MPPNTHTAPSTPPATRARDRRATTDILVVDDDPDMVNSLARILKTRSYAVRRAFDGIEGVKQVIDRCPGIVVLDLQMPGLDGIQACKEMRQINPELPVIFISGDPNLADHARETGAVEVLPKPINFEVLFDILEEMAPARSGVTHDQDRRGTGFDFAEGLEPYRKEPDLLVLALRKWSVPAAFEVARELGAELDVLMGRELTIPGTEEIVMGAIASGGVTIRDRDVLKNHFISNNEFKKVKHRELGELLRSEFDYRGNHRRLPEAEGRCVILVDGGLASCAMWEAAVETVRRREAAHVVIAIPAAPEQTMERLMDLADDVICLRKQSAEASKQVKGDRGDEPCRAGTFLRGEISG